MKVIREIELDACDVPGCGNVDLCRICLACGIAHCWDHGTPLPDGAPPDPKRDPHGVSYDSLVWGGGGPGYYCIPCDERLSRERTDALHTAYQRIQSLQTRYQEEYERNKLEVAHAEAELTKERERRGQP